MYQNQYFVILCYFDLQNLNSLAVAINSFFVWNGGRPVKMRANASLILIITYKHIIH